LLEVTVRLSKAPLKELLNEVKLFWKASNWDSMVLKAVSFVAILCCCRCNSVTWLWSTASKPVMI
jgi:hypothetical protein